MSNLEKRLKVIFRAPIKVVFFPAWLLFQFLATIVVWLATEDVSWKEAWKW